MNHIIYKLRRGRWKTLRAHQDAQALLEQRRRETRDARHKHAAMLHCDGRDILSAADIENLRKTFNAFLAAHELLVEAAYKADTAMGREIRAIAAMTGVDSPP